MGGCVRDLLLGFQPKDFDIATNARPEEIRKLFKNCRLIGKRFRLAHIVFGQEIIEVATFRGHHAPVEDQHGSTREGMIVRDNVFGTIEDDVWRRDFTVNALYYNIADFSVVDYIQGMEDIKTRSLRIIGDPEQRFKEDPVRLLRAVRIMGKLRLQICPKTEASIRGLSHLLQQVSSARLFQEVLKFFGEGELLPTFKLLQKYHLFSQLFPQTAAFLQHDTVATLVEIALQNTDARLRSGKTVSPAFLLAVFLWPAISERVKQQEETDLPHFVMYEKAIHDTLKNQTKQLAMPRRLQLSIHDICFLQHRLTQRQGARPHRLMEHVRFRAAYDLLVLREKAGEPLRDLSEWWTSFIEADPTERENLIRSIEKTKSSTTKRRKKRSRSSKKKVTPPAIPIK